MRYYTAQAFLRWLLLIFSIVITFLCLSCDSGGSDDSTDGDQLASDGDFSNIDGDTSGQQCPNGFVWDDSEEMCVPGTVDGDEPQCPDGMVYDEERDMCKPGEVVDGDEHQCPSGMVYDEESGMCKPESSTDGDSTVDGDQSVDGDNTSCQITDSCDVKHCRNNDSWCYDNCGDPDHLAEDCGNRGCEDGKCQIVWNDASDLTP